MAILSGLSAIAYQQITEDLRMSAAKNTITAALDNARAMAIKKNRYVMTVFRPRLEDGGNEQVIDIVVAGWDGDSANAESGSGSVWTYDRFVPIPGLEVRTISGGINVAGPGYGTGDDTTWWASSHLPTIVTGEVFGSMVGILYNPEGRVVVRNAKSGSDRIWVDFNQDGLQQISESETVQWPWPSPLPGNWAYFDLESAIGEPFISMTHVLCVFNETDCRLQNDLSTWVTNPQWQNDLRNSDITEYIEENAERIQFNKYSGVPLK